MAKVNSVNNSRKVSQEAVESMSAAYAARQAFQEAQLMNQFSQLLGQAVVQIAAQTKAPEPEEKKTSADLTELIVPQEKETSKPSQEQIQAPEQVPAETVKEASAEAEPEVTTPEGQETLAEETSKPVVADTGKAVEGQAEAVVSELPCQVQVAAASTQVVKAVKTDAAECVAPAEKTPVQNEAKPVVPAAAQTAAEAVTETAETVTEVKEAVQTAQKVQTAAPQQAAGAAKVAPAQSSDEAVKPVQIPAAQAAEAAVAAVTESPAVEVVTADKRPLPAAQPSTATHAEKVVPVNDPKPAQTTQSSSETQELVVKIMQDIREKASLSEARAQTSPAQASAKTAVEPLIANVVNTSAIPAQALQSVEKSLRFQTIGNSQLAEIAQSAGRDVTRVQNIQTALNFTTSGVATARNDQNSSSSRDLDTSKAPKFLTRADTLRTLEKVENAIREVARSHDGKTISVRLDPPTLGSLKIDLTMRDGSMHARIVAELPQVASMLRDKVHELQNLIRQVGFDADQVSVSVGEQNSQKDQQTEYLEQSWFGAAAGEKRGLAGTLEADASAANGAAGSGKLAEDHWVA